MIVWGVAAIAVAIVGWAVFRERGEVPGDIAIDQVDFERVAEVVVWLKYEPKPWRQKLDWVATRLPQKFGLGALKTWLTRDRGTERADAMMDLLRHLGPRAEPILPQLTLVMKDRRPAISERGIRALGFVGKAALTNLLRARLDPAQPNKSQINWSITRMGPWDTHTDRVHA